MPKKILIIDDEPEFLKLLKKRLEFELYVVVTAENGEKGFELALNERPDFIIIDVCMPFLNGLTFVYAAKHMKEIKEIPILIITASQTRDLFIGSKIVNFMRKPYDKDELIKNINFCLSK